MKPGYTFPQDRLPAGFRYPQAYLDLVEQPERLAESSWWLIGKNPGFADFCLEVLQGMGGSKILIPFAKDDESNDLACFDGADLGGSPRVYFLVAEASIKHVDWTKRYSQSFEAWLTEALG